jgi:hypothetical protein
LFCGLFQRLALAGSVARARVSEQMKKLWANPIHRSRRIDGLKRMWRDDKNYRDRKISQLRSLNKQNIFQPPVDFYQIVSW